MAKLITQKILHGGDYNPDGIWVGPGNWYENGLTNVYTDGNANSDAD